MNVQEFEDLKNRKEKLSILKAKEEAKIEALNKEVEVLMSDLKSMGINTIEEATSKLSELETEYNSLLNEIGNVDKELNSVQII